MIVLDIMSYDSVEIYGYRFCFWIWALNIAFFLSSLMSNYGTLLLTGACYCTFCASCHLITVDIATKALK